MNQFCPRSVEEAVKFHSLIVVENPLKTYHWVTLLCAFLPEHEKYTVFILILGFTVLLLYILHRK